MSTAEHNASLEAAIDRLAIPEYKREVLAVAAVIKDLELRNRAYNLLYALGAQPASVATLRPGEAERLVALAQEVYQGAQDTFFHRLILANVSAPQLRYVALGTAEHTI